MAQCSQPISKLFDAGFLHQIFRPAIFLEVAPHDQPIHFRVHVR